MRGKLSLLFVLALPIACTGCEMMAATMAGGSMFAFGTYYVNGCAEETVKTPLADTEPVAHWTLKDFGLTIMSATQTLENQQVVKTDFRAGIENEDFEAVHISLMKISEQATRIRVTARKGKISPDYPTAEAILNSMIKDLNPITVAQLGGT